MSKSFSQLSVYSNVCLSSVPRRFFRCLQYGNQIGIYCILRLQRSVDPNYVTIEKFSFYSIIIFCSTIIKGAYFLVSLRTWLIEYFLVFGFICYHYCFWLNEITWISGNVLFSFLRIEVIFRIISYWKKTFYRSYLHNNVLIELNW